MRTVLIAVNIVTLLPCFSLVYSFLTRVKIWLYANVLVVSFMTFWILHVVSGLSSPQAHKHGLMLTMSKQKS